MSSPKLGKRVYKLNKPQCVPPLYHWVVNSGCYEVDNSDTDEKSKYSEEEKNKVFRHVEEIPKIRKSKRQPSAKEEKTVDYLIEMLGPLYQKCKTEGITYDQLQEHINNLVKEGKCRDCSVEDFQNLCKLKSSSNSFFDLVEKTQNLNVIRNFIDEYPDCLSEKKLLQYKWKGIPLFNTPILYIYNQLRDKKNTKNINDLVEYILLKYPEKCNLENRLDFNQSLIHMIIRDRNNKLLKVLLEVGKRIGANKIGLDLMIDDNINDEFKTSTFKEFNTTPLMQCFNTHLTLKECYSSIIYMLDNFSAKELNLRGDNGNISALLYIAVKIYSDYSYKSYNKEIYNIITKILSFGAEECYLNRGVPHIGTFFLWFFNIHKSDNYPQIVLDLWKKLSNFSAEELNVGYVRHIDKDKYYSEITITAFKNCISNLFEENMNIAEEMIDRYGDKLNFETIVSLNDEPSTVLQFCLMKHIDISIIRDPVARNKFIKVREKLYKVILKLLNEYSEKCNIGFVNKYTKDTINYEYTVLELLLTSVIRIDRALPEYVDLVEKLMSFGPKQLNFNHISPDNTYCFNSIYRMSNSLLSNSMKLIAFCNTIKKTFGDMEINNRLENLLIECFNWDLADNLLDNPPLNNTWGYSPISACMVGRFKNAILNLLERGAEFNKLNNLYFIQLAGGGQVRITALIGSIIIRLADITDRLLDFTNEELNLAFVNERGLSALVRVNNLVLELQGGGDVDPMFIEIKRRIRQKLGLPEVEQDDEQEEQDPEWFRQLPVEAQEQSVHQKAKVKKVDKQIKKLLKYPYILELEEAAETFSKKIEGRIKPNDIYECQEKIYGFGDIHDQAIVRGLPEDKKVSACKLFQVIWSIIRNVKDKEVKEEMTNRLEEEMSDCVKKGICSTGWATRLINTLGGYEDIVDKSLGEEEDEKEEKEIDAGWIIENYKNNYSKMLSEKMDELAGELSDEEYDEIMEEMTMNFEDQRKYKDIKLEIGEKFREFVKNQEPNVKDEVLDEAIEELVKTN